MKHLRHPQKRLYALRRPKSAFPQPWTGTLTVPDILTLRAELAAHYDLAPSMAAAEATKEIYAKMSRVVPLADWATYAPYVIAINRLKAERNAVILGHNYMTPEIYHGVADFVGDSLQLAIKATEVEADVIVQCGVHFMAETSKIMNPAKIVLMPDMQAGCSLAESITADGVAEMRAMYPGAPVVSYVNTTAEVKAASDICCTSANALQIVNAMEGDTVIMTPDQYLARNVAALTHKRVVWWEGSCIVHELYTAADLRAYRENDPEVKIIAHPECTPEVVAEADFTGSTKGIIDWVHEHKPAKAMLVTECSMAANIADELPEVEFAKPCNMCPYMKMITLEKILYALHSMTGRVEVDPKVSARARVAVQRMIDISRRAA
jgi:quinolinate synthase